MRKMLMTLLLLWGTAAVLCAQDLDEKYAAELLKPGTEAPDMYIGRSKEGKPMRLSDLRGRHVLLYFWASWCGDCRRETPALKEIACAYPSDKVQLVGISYDTDSCAMQDYVKEQEIDWMVYSELKKWKKDTTTDRLYHISWIPTLYLIAPDGKVALATVMVDKVAKMLETLYKE